MLWLPPRLKRIAARRHRSRASPPRRHRALSDSAAADGLCTAAGLSESAGLRAACRRSGMLEASSRRRIAPEAYWFRSGASYPGFSSAAHLSTESRAALRQQAAPARATRSPFLPAKLPAQTGQLKHRAGTTQAQQPPQRPAPLQDLGCNQTTSKPPTAPQNEGPHPPSRALARRPALYRRPTPRKRPVALLGPLHGFSRDAAHPKRKKRALHQSETSHAEGLRQGRHLSIFHPREGRLPRGLRRRAELSGDGGDEKGAP